MAITIAELLVRLGVTGADQVGREVTRTAQTAESSSTRMTNAFRRVGDIITSAFRSDRVRQLGTSLSSLSTTVDKQEKDLSELKKEYQNLYLTQGKSADETKACAEEIKRLSKELATNKKRLQESENAADDFDESMNDVNNTVEKSGSKLGSALKKIGLAVAAAFAVDKIKDFGVTIVNVAAEVKAQASQYAQTFGDMEGEATAAISRIAETTGILDTRLQMAGSSIFAFARSSGASVPEAMTLMEEALMASADSAAYYDKSLDESSETLKSFLKGNFENDAALGVSATEFTRNAKATELFGKKYNDLSEIQKQQTLLKMVTDSQKVSGAFGQASRESDGWENVMGNLKETWRQFKAQLGMPLMEALIPLIQELTVKFKAWSESIDWDEFGRKVTSTIDGIVNAVKWVIDNWGWIKTLGAIILGIAAAIGVLNGILAIQSAIMMANPTTWIVLGIVAAIAALIAIIVVLVKNWDKVKEAADKCWNWIKDAWGKAGEWFKKIVIDPIVKFFTGLWDGIKKGAGAAWTWIKTTWQSATTWFKTTIIDPIANFFKNLWSGIKNTATNTWNGIKTTTANVWNSIKTAIMTPINKARDAVKAAIDKIKGFFNFKWSLPKLKVPKFGIKPKGWKIGDLLDGKIPKLSVQWMAEGGIFNEPTLFNSSSGTYGVGEAGPEAVAPIDKLTGYVQNAVKQETNGISNRLDRITDLLVSFFPQMLETGEKEIVLNSGVLVGQLAPKMNSKFGDIARANTRGR